MNHIDVDVTERRFGPLVIMRGTATPSYRVSHPECFGRFTVVAFSHASAIRACMRRVARMCAANSARERMDREAGACE